MTNKLDVNMHPLGNAFHHKVPLASPLWVSEFILTSHPRLLRMKENMSERFNSFAEEQKSVRDDRTADREKRGGWKMMKDDKVVWCHSKGNWRTRKSLSFAEINLINTLYQFVYQVTHPSVIHQFVCIFVFVSLSVQPSLHRSIP